MPTKRLLTRPRPTSAARLWLVALAAFGALRAKAQQCDVDLCIVLDGSESIKSDGWTASVDFVRQVAAKLNVGPSRLAIVQQGRARYISDVAACCALATAAAQRSSGGSGCNCTRLEMTFFEGSNEQSVITTINGLSNAHMNGFFTDITRGMKLCQNQFQFFPRNGASKEMIVVSDGVTNFHFHDDDPATNVNYECLTQSDSACVNRAEANFEARSAAVKSAGISLSFVGVGDPNAASASARRRDDLMTRFASSAQRYLTVSAAADLLSAADAARALACGQPAPAPPPPRCAAPYDVVMVMDGSGSIDAGLDGENSTTQVLNAMNIVLSMFMPTETGNHVGLVSFNISAHELSPLSSSLARVRQGVDAYRAEGDTAVGRGIAKGDSVRAAGARSGVKSILVLMTDGESSVTTSGAAASSAVAEFNRFDIVLIVFLSQSRDYVRGKLSAELEDLVATKLSTQRVLTRTAAVAAAAGSTNSLTASFQSIIDELCVNKGGGSGVFRGEAGGSQDGSGGDGTVLGMEAWLLGVIGGAAALCCAAVVAAAVCCVCVARRRKKKQQHTLHHTLSRRGGTLSRSMSRSASRYRRGGGGGGGGGGLTSPRGEMRYNPLSI